MSHDHHCSSNEYLPSAFPCRAPLRRVWTPLCELGEAPGKASGYPAPLDVVGAETQSARCRPCTRAFTGEGVEPGAQRLALEQRCPIRQVQSTLHSLAQVMLQHDQESEAQGRVTCPRRRGAKQWSRGPAPQNPLPASWGFLQQEAGVEGGGVPALDLALALP